MNIRAEINKLSFEDRTDVLISLLAKDGLGEATMKAFICEVEKLPSRGRAALAGLILNKSDGLPDPEIIAFVKELSKKNKSYLNAYAACKGFS